MSDLIRTKQSILALIREAEEIVHQCGKTLDEMDDYLSEFLTAKGVIVPPCKVGDTVYCIAKGFKEPIEAKIDSIIPYSDRLIMRCKPYGYYGHYCIAYKEAAFGKKFFLSREEAEAALKGANDGKAD